MIVMIILQFGGMDHFSLSLYFTVFYKKTHFYFHNHLKSYFLKQCMNK